MIKHYKVIVFVHTDLKRCAYVEICVFILGSYSCLSTCRLSYERWMLSYILCHFLMFRQTDVLFTAEGLFFLVLYIHNIDIGDVLKAPFHTYCAALIQLFVSQDHKS